MKFRTLLSALLIAASFVCVTGCKKAAPAKKAAEAKKATPTEITQKLLDAAKAGDFAAVAQFCDGELKMQAEAMPALIKAMEAKAAQGDAKAKKALAEFKKNQKEGTFQIKSEAIDGDFAIVEYTLTTGDKTKEEKGYLKKVNGEWKAISKKDYAKAKKADEAK